MFTTLESIFARPKPYERITTSDLWTDEHTSKKMLEFHLNAEIDLSSRNHPFIERSVDWFASEFEFGNRPHVVDFGCGPGLYTQKFAQRGARVSGIDFSLHSLQYARKQAEEVGLAIDYIHKDYLTVDGLEPADLITLIFCDYCALSPEQRQTLLGIFKRNLAPNGEAVLDVWSATAYAKREENQVCQKNQLDGFWSPDDYYAFVHTFKYDEEMVVLDKYTIVEEERTRQVYNWLSYFTPESLQREIERAGLRVRKIMGDVAGAPYDETRDEFAVIIQPE